MACTGMLQVYGLQGRKREESRIGDLGVGLDCLLPTTALWHTAIRIV